MDSTPDLKVSLQSKITIAKESFQAALSHTSTGLAVGAGWQNERHHKLELKELLPGVGLPVPDYLDWALELKEIKLYYHIQEKIFLANITAVNGHGITVGARMKEELYKIQWDPKIFLKWKSLPAIGSYFGETDGLELKALQAIYKKGEGCSFQFLLAAVFRGDCYELGKLDKFGKPDELNGVEDPPEDFMPAETKQEVHDKELNKKIGPVFLRRIGGSFKDGAIVVSVDAGIKISFLTLEVIDLYVGVRPGEKFQFQYGLKGFAVSVVKPPLFISGGLYVAKPWSLFNGQLTVRYGKFGFIALGSYGHSEDGSSSFFVYLMLDYALGGPPCFYITGICGGFGVNRKIHLPELTDVDRFPFIAAVRGTSKDLKPASSPTEVLRTLSDVIEPCEGVNFLTAGVKFTSFGMVESIVIINVEFGTRFELSLLGTSEISLPPKAAHPIVYARLNLRAVFCPDDGILTVEGALSKDSYLFAKDAHLTGGFAFYSWFKGERAGDFVLSVGGYHPQFKRRHYPAVERVGLNWIINGHLDLKGEAYFALTPNCLMAGGRLELNYHIGKLKAWCFAYADFLIQWKPFHYDLAIGVSIGASYRLDAWFIHHTFKVELGADLHLWGPEFSGTAHIKWHIISFTIHFNSGNKNAPKKIGWTEFKQDFLPDLSGGIVGTQVQGTKLCRLNLTNGYLGVKNCLFPGMQRMVPVYYVDAAQFGAEIESALPLSQVSVNQSEKVRQGRKFGIVPMGMGSLSNSLEITFEKIEADGSGSFVSVCGEQQTKQQPRALWDTKQPGMNEEMLGDVAMGYRFGGERQITYHLPWYQLEKLLQNEEYQCPYHYQWICEEETKNLVSGEESVADTIVENAKRSEWLRQMKAYGIRGNEEIQTGNFARHMDKILSAPMEIRSTGYRKR